jgi:hypothetical protein
VAGQSITFDFLTTGVDRTAGGMRKVGDNAALAARGAKVLSNVIETLGDKENRTAAESVLLAKALRQTGEAADRTAAKMVLADAAVRRLDDAMQDSTKSTGGLSKALGELKLNPGLVGPALLLAPAMTTLAGAAAGAGAALGGAFIAGGLALGAFGAVAKPILTDAKKANEAVQKAQVKYNIAISQGVPQAKAFKAEQKDLAKAYAGLSPAQIALSKQLGAMADSWDQVKTAETPVIAGALQPWLKSVTDLTKNLGPIIAKVAPVIGQLGGQFDHLVGSSAFVKFRDFIANTGSQAVGAIGGTIIDLVKSFITLLPQFNPLIEKGVGWIARLGPAVARWANSQKTADQITKFMAWFHDNGPVVGELLKNAGAALAALAPGLTSGGALELKVISDFLGFIAKLPPGLAKPLAEVAGALLILNKLGVVSVGFKLLGLGGAGGGIGGAASGAAAGAAAGGLWSRILPGARLVGGALVISLIIDQILQNPKNPKVLGNTDPNAPWNSFTSNQSLGGKLINFFKQTGDAAQQAAPKVTHFGDSMQGILPQVARFGTSAGPTATKSFTNTGQASDVAKAKLGEFAALAQDKVNKALIAAGTHADTLRISHLGPLGSKVDAVSTQTGHMQGVIANPVSPANAGAHADTFKNQHLEPLRSKIQAVDAQTRTMQTTISGLHGKTINVNVTGSGSGGVKLSATGLGPKLIMLSRLGGGLAGGGLVSMGSGPVADDVPAMLSKGELVVPARMVSAGAVDHLRGRLPGFAAGGLATLGRQSAALPAAAGSAAAGDIQSWMSQDVGAILTAIKAQLQAANPFAGITGVPSGAKISGSAQAAMNFAKSILWAYGWGMDQWPSLFNLWMGESGWNYRAYNASSGATGIPQSLPGSKMASAGADWQTNPATQIRWGLGYIKSVYGSPANAYSRWLGRSPHWYGGGGLVPGYASGGTVGQQGSAWLRAWQTRHGGGFGAAHGPVVVNEQIARMAAAAGRARALAGASGLSPGQHRFWASAAADETRRLGVLHKEAATERAWRYQLQLQELSLDREIRAAGNLPGLAGPARGWKAQLGRDKAKVAAIGKMLGHTDAYLAAHKPPRKVIPPGVPGSIPHTGVYTDSTADLIRELFASLASNSRVVTMDSGGVLAPGWSQVLNATGRPELLVPAGRGGGATVVLQNHGVIGSQAQLEEWLVRSVDSLKRKRRI